jgi:hypothetical protein
MFLVCVCVFQSVFHEYLYKRKEMKTGEEVKKKKRDKEPTINPNGLSSWAG